MRGTVLCLMGLLAAGSAQAAPETWLLSIDRWGNVERRTAVLDAAADGSVTGRLGDRPLAGRLENGRLSVATTGEGDPVRLEATIADDRMTGEADLPDTNDDAARQRHALTGRRLPEVPAGPPGRRTFTPDGWFNAFTAEAEPVLFIRPGEIISTQTIDSGGVDAAGVTRALYGNPQTGPFFVLGAEPGQMLAVRIRKLSLNRDWADSLSGLVGRALTPGMAANGAGRSERVRWRLDRAAGMARLENPPERLKDYVVPVRPMLGGLGVAPDFGFQPFSAGDTGRFGGNIDFNGLGEGATVYLPVYQPGALLFLGDGHALQGDGEVTQWALETSLDVEFSVQLLPARPMSGPRIETEEGITTIGQDGSLDEALKQATSGMIQWLAQDYGLTPAESSLILGTAAQYRVVTLAGRNAGMALSLDKARLAGLPTKVEASGAAPR